MVWVRILRKALAAAYVAVRSRSDDHFVPPLRGVQVLRAGLAVGRLRGKAFVPDHALSRVCRPRTVFPVREREALSYLRGETLPASDDARGFGVVSLDGLPLGWGKASDGQIKNHYPKGLRKP